MASAGRAVVAVGTSTFVSTTFPTSSAACSARRGAPRPDDARERPRRGHDLEAELHLLVPGGGRGRRDDGQRCERDTVLDLRRVGLTPRVGSRHLPALQRSRRAERQPGHVLAVLALPGLPGPGDPHRRSLPGLQRDRPRAAPTPGQGPDPRRGGGRPAHPRERARASRGRTMGRPGTSTWWCTSRLTRCSGRRGRNLTLTVPITYPEAALGGAIKVPSLTEPVTLKIPPGTRQGRTFRVKGKGITSGSSTGDLLVTVDVVVPAHLTEDQRHAVEALAKTLDSLASTSPGGVNMAYDPSQKASANARQRAVYVISVAAELAGVHPQTLRIYERKGLLDPAPDRRGQPPLQRGRHRPPAAHPTAHRRRAEPGRRAARDGARDRDRAACAPSSRRPARLPARRSSRPTASTGATSCRSRPPACPPGADRQVAGPPAGPHGHT